MEKIRREHEKKHGNKYVIEFTDYDEKNVYEWLSHALTRHYINKSDYYSRITRVNLYSGYCRITVKYKGVDARDVYTVKD